MRGREKYIYYTLALGILVLLQVWAQATQWSRGFRPFSHAPARVPYSWDMFAIKMDRCAIDWSPPLRVEGLPVSRWRDRSAPIEFDTVYNDEARYEAAAMAGCRYQSAPDTVASLLCLTSDGGAHERTLDCP